MAKRYDKKKIETKALHTSKFNEKTGKYVVDKIICPTCLRTLLQTNIEYSIQDKINSYQNNTLIRFIESSIKQKLKKKGLTSCPECKQLFDLKDND